MYIPIRDDVQLTNDWTPTTEALPEPFRTVLMILKNEDDQEIEIMSGTHNPMTGWTRSWKGMRVNRPVIAWTSLPQIFKL